MLRLRPIGTAVLAVATTVLMVLATVSTWVHFEVLAPDALGTHVRQSLREPEVRDELASEIARRVTRSDPRLFAAAPVVRQAAEILVSSRQFADVLEIAMQQVRQAVTQDSAVTSSRLADLEAQLRQTLEVIDPSIAAQIPSNWDTSVVNLTRDAAVPTAMRTAQTVGRLWWLWCSLAVVSTLGWIACAYNRRRAIAAFGMSLGLVGLTLVAARRFVGDRFAEEVDATSRAALRAAYDVTTADLYRVGVAFLAAGAVVVAATITGVVASNVVSAVAQRFERIARMPVTPRARALWGVGAACVGGFLALSATRIGPVVAVVVGAALAFAGVNVFARAVPSHAPERRIVSWRHTMAFAAILAMLATVVVIERGVDGGGGDTAADVDPDTLVCNGHADLCAKRLDEVTLAGSHNAMASAADGFLFAQQTLTMRQQLASGARVLMLDTHYGIPTSRGLVLTDLVFNDRAALVERYGEETVQNIEQLRSTVVQPAAPASVYLCHTFCELGATPASTAFAEIRKFIAENPSEVLVLMIQDETEGVDTVRAMRAAGLDEVAYAKPADEPWPTLGDLVRAGTPLIVLSQREGGRPPWFMPMFSLVQDNPYAARSVSELSCAPNRGPRKADLFLLNHWITRSTPNIGDARRINRAEFVVERVHECEEERGQRVNFIAVDFWGAGDVLTAVDELNGEQD